MDRHRKRILIILEKEYQKPIRIEKNLENHGKLIIYAFVLYNEDFEWQNPEKLFPGVD